MSAITGIFYRDGRSVDPELMKKMNDRLSHRGPDGSAVWCDGSVGLGHQMLWTTPESLHEHLPFEENGLVITADARIDNRDELSGKLGIQDKEEVSDSYFILKAYEKWGEKCPDKLLGDFAFAIWDKKEERLFCARDHMGVKPFYYYLDDDMFVFGTEIKALFEVEGVPREINELKIALYLLKDTSDNELTFFKTIIKLPSANSIIINKFRKEIKQYWKLNPNLQLKLDSEEEYAQNFRKIFSEAIKCRLRSNFPIGSELSGGLDSSSIVCMTKKINSNKNLKTFSRVFDCTPESDERYYINQVINIEGIEPYFINVDNISPIENIEKILWFQDQPFYTPHMTKQIKTYTKIQKEGTRVLLSGQGGDQNVSMGNNYLKELALTFNWIKLIKEVKGYSFQHNKNKVQIILEKIIFPTLPYSIKRLIKLIFGKNQDLILNPEFLKKLGIKKREYELYSDNLSKIKAKDYHYYVINYAFNETVFETIDRRVSDSNLEVRYPFFDKRLIEFCYSLPTEMKVKNGWNRYIMRIAMENILPSEIQWRSNKTDLSPTYKKNLFLFEKSTLENMIYQDNDIIINYVDLKKIKSIFKNYESKTSQFDLWLVFLLYLWLKFENKNIKNK